jgi:hypothetical protein
MTEADWLTCTDSRAMLAYLQANPGTGDRKLWLFAVACIRRVSHPITDDGSRQAVGVLDRLADGRVTRGERVDAAFLSQCWAPGPHARGCWHVDLVRGKS